MFVPESKLSSSTTHSGYRATSLKISARDWGLRFDWAGFDKALEEQRTKARASWKGGAGKEAVSPAYAKIAETFKTEKDFYHGTSAKDARIEAILTKSGPVSELKAGETGEVVLDRTVIYAESGGQMADTGGVLRQLGLATARRSYRRLLPRRRACGASSNRQGNSARRRSRLRRSPTPNVTRASFATIRGRTWSMRRCVTYWEHT